MASCRVILFHRRPVLRPGVCAAPRPRFRRAVLDRARRPLALVLWAGLLACAGCSSSGKASPWGLAFVPKSRFESLQVQNRTLAERARAQQAEIENMKIHTHNVEDQLIRAEEDLARLDDRNRRQKLARGSSPTDERGGSTMPAGLSGRLADLAERYPSLHYDPQSGISKFDSDVLFDSGEAQLKADAKKMLSEFAEIFQAPEARDLKIMVVGHTDARGIKGREARAQYPTNWHLSTARALAVVDRLRDAGLPENRMGIAGFGQHQPISPNDTAASRQKNRRVEIFVVGPETPVVGWTETLQSVYR